MKNPTNKLNSETKKVHKVAMECMIHLMNNEGFNEKDATNMVLGSLKELNDGGYFALGYKAVIANLKMTFMDVPLTNTVLDMIQ